MDIVLKNISKYFGEKEVLKNLDLTIEKGKVTGITGESGVGKTSLLKILMGIDRGFTGEVLGIEDKRISVVFQENRLCENLTVKMNIRIINEKISDSEMDRCLNRLGLKEALNIKVSDLSGGMKRRVAILRALLNPFDMLILDEPFKGLDSKNKRKTVEFLKSKIKGKEVIIVTHDKLDGELFEDVNWIEL
ncbi:ATP-binding cassette domain-containing protein [uncultured Clostridium sp.]|uniref:ATP-binding cassette domain-containing protein n=1 Tax=uncultured Clostridium sp. TaxID=59620 RepID=UPI00262D5772|nr:ATP-binding cassette domain-containing protein [uncultured Clostridium sp.]